MLIKAKLRKVGNSFGILVPKEVLLELAKAHQVGKVDEKDFILLNVITNWSETEKYWEDKPGVITQR